MTQTDIYEQLNIDFNEAVKYFFGDKNYTWQDMCEKIAEYKVVINKSTGNVETDPISIFNYSPTGELFWIKPWFVEAYCEALRTERKNE